MILVVVDLLSVLLFGCPALTLTQFFIGSLGIYGQIKETNSMKKTRNDLERWVGASAGLYTAKLGIDNEFAIIHR